MRRILLLASSLLLLATITAQTQNKSNAATPSGGCCGFRSNNTVNFTNNFSQGKKTVMKYDSILFDDSKSFDGSIYTVQKEGVHQFNTSICLKVNNNTGYVQSFLLKINAGNQFVSQIITIPVDANEDDSFYSGSISGLFKLQKGDKVFVTVDGVGYLSASTVSNMNYFSGACVY